jgi:hypothetical protein
MRHARALHLAYHWVVNPSMGAQLIAALNLTSASPVSQVAIPHSVCDGRILSRFISLSTKCSSGISRPQHILATTISAHVDLWCVLIPVLH